MRSYTPGFGQGVLLTHRIPRQPSTLRITICRKLDWLGVARLGDGLVALPADARTRDQMEGRPVRGTAAPPMPRILLLCAALGMGTVLLS